MEIRVTSDILVVEIHVLERGNELHVLQIFMFWNIVGSGNVCSM